MSALLLQQQQFAAMVMRLLSKAHGLGYMVTLGHAYRCENCYTGAAKSFHKQRLAIDLNLFQDGVYLPDTEAHQALGEWWESIGGTWGGRFNPPDGNHYSLGEGR